ncbi:SusD family protein [Bacteroidales bacterium Barb4]|nr:SusD family protein [Bacteroidales bacterium Barb4]
MKKAAILLTLGASLVTSCVDLELSPKDSIVLSSYFQTEADAVAAVTGVYSVLTYAEENTPLYGGQLVYLTDLASDYMRTGSHSNSSETRAIGSASYDAGNYEIKRTWILIFRGISRANLAIANIPNTSGISEEIKDRLVREAKFLRALYYFNAVQLWGDVPLILNETYEEADLNRAPIDDVYKQIISDLTEAQKLPASYSGAADVGRATGGAATALLARVYLVRGDWANAIKYARDVISSNEYELVTTVKDLFNPDTKNGREHIFSAQFTTGQKSAAASGNANSHCTWSSGFSNAEPVSLISNVELFYDIFDDNDQRKDASYAKRLYNPKTDSIFVFDIPRFRKYIDTAVVLTSSSGASRINAPVIRYAEVLLTLAEAINEQSGPNAEAYEAINQVRRRAFSYDIQTKGSPVDFSGLTQQQFREKLRQERYLEFVIEQVRWYDLTRWKILVESTNKTKQIGKRNYRYPIPQAERDLNPKGLWQNWGYDGATADDPYDATYK